jgi:hypothetical protein
MYQGMFRKSTPLQIATVKDMKANVFMHKTGPFGVSFKNLEERYSSRMICRKWDLREGGFGDDDTLL